MKKSERNMFIAGAVCCVIIFTSLIVVDVQLKKEAKQLAEMKASLVEIQTSLDSIDDRLDSIEHGVNETYSITWAQSIREDNNQEVSDEALQDD